MFILTVKVKDSERKYSRDFPIYATCTVSQDDPIIADCVKATIDDFKDDSNEELDVKFIIKCEVVNER